MLVFAKMRSYNTRLECIDYPVIIKLSNNGLLAELTIKPHETQKW